MKGLKLLLACTIAFSTVAPALAKKDVDDRTFWQKHKGKFAKGAAIAAAIGIAIGVGFHVDKTRRAISKAGIKSSDDEFEDAVAVVALLGPLGMDRTLTALSKAVEKNVITANFAADIVFSDIGAALAYYFGVSPTEFRAKAGVKGMKETGRRLFKKGKEGFKKGWNAFTASVV